MKPAPPVTSTVETAPSRPSSASEHLLEAAPQISRIVALAECAGPACDLFSGDIALVQRNLFKAHEHQALAVLERADEGGGFQQALGRPGVEPRIAAPEPYDAELSSPEIGLVDVADLDLATNRGPHGGGDVEHGIVIEIEAGDSPVG